MTPRRILSSLTLAFALGLPAVAQDAPSDDGPGLEDPPGLLDRGTRMLIEDLLDRLEPGLEALREGIEDFHGYHAPEVLPNGDIIIRRKRPDPFSEIDPDGGTDI